MNEDTLSLVRKVADVEATPEERMALFAMAEENSEIWRELAMRLIEEASWRKSLRSLSGKTTPSVRSPKPWKAWVPALSGIAAGLLLGIGLPRLSLGQPKPTPTHVDPNAMAVAEPTWYQGNPRLSGLPAAGTQVEAIDEAIVHPVVREKLKQLGVEVQESNVIFLVENEDGNRVAFPSRQAAFRFVNDPNSR